jgi:hypothetical protein
MRGVMKNFFPMEGNRAVKSTCQPLRVKTSFAVAQPNPKFLAMKKLFALAAVLLFAAGTFAKDQTPAATTPFVWCGLDYSQVRMIGPGEFNNPEAIFPGVCDSWNNLFLQERIRHVEQDLKQSLTLDLDAVTALNKQTSASQVIGSPSADDVITKTHLSSDQIAQLVKAYNLKTASGTGIVFIADRFVKFDKKGNAAIYVVAFDIATRKVIFSERTVNRAGGFGFRNYWFHCVKESESALKKLR